MKKNILKILFLVFLFPLSTFAQGTATDPTLPPSDGGVVIPESSSEAVPAKPTTIAPVSPISTSAPSSATSPKPTSPSKSVVIPPLAPISITQTETSVTPSTSDQNSKNYLGFILSALAVGLGTFLFVKLNSKKNKNDNKKCGNIKKLMEEKLNELTDLRGQLVNIAKKEGKEQIKSMVSGTRHGELLALVEKGNKEYERLKGLYEKCITSLLNVKRVFIIHGTEGYPQENWFPWLKEKLEAKGCKVLVPQFPSPPIVPAKISEWFEVLKKYEQEINENTILIGHSLGGVFTLRILEKLDKPIHTVFFVGTPIGIQPIINYDRDSSFSDFDFNWGKIKKNANYFTVFHSDNDPYVGLENGKELAKNLGVELSFVPNAGHFNKKAGYTKFEELWEKLEPLLDK